MNTYKGIEVVTGKQIQDIHKISRNSLYGRFYNRRDILKEGVDFFLVSKEEAKMLPYVDSGRIPNGLLLYTATGYKKMFDKEFKPSKLKKLFGNEESKAEEKKNFKKDDPKKKEIKTEKDPDNVNKELLETLNADREAYMRIITQQYEQIKELIGIIGKTINTSLTVSEPEEPAEEKATMTEWYTEIENLVSLVAEKSGLARNAVLSSAYKTLNAQYGLCIDQYKKEYAALVHKQPTVLSTLYWVETEKNPNTKGLLSDVLSNMLSGKE